MKFWKNNKLNQEFEMPTDEVIRRFKEWLTKQGEKESAKLREYYTLDRLMRMFLTEPNDGLSSTFDEKEYEHLFKEAVKAGL